MTAFKQRLTSATELSCHQGAIFVGSKRKNNANLTTDYTGDVRSITQKNLTEKRLENITISPSVDAVRVSVTTSGNLSFLLGGVLPKSNQYFSVSQSCLIAPNVPDPSSTSTLIFSESFEENHTVGQGNWNVIDTANTWFNSWTTSGAGLEINGQASLTSGKLRFGNFFAELDSDCKNASSSQKVSCANTTNSSIIRNMTLKGGNHEIRYWYNSRKDKSGIDYNKYGNAETCSDLTKAKGAGRDDFEQRAINELAVAQAQKDGWTFRIELYVEKKSDALYQVENLTDVCVWTKDWVERKLTFTVPSAGDYRIVWRGAGRQDTYGGLLDYIRICEGVCP
ncbi:hypothetical protein [Methylobacterium iners]|nr:hypothetical protein [Methylobacterium iners]